MNLALVFGTPLLLVGLVAAAIPPLLHLLAARGPRRCPFPRCGSCT